MDMNTDSLIIFALGSAFGIVLSYWVSDLVFPPSEQVEDEE